MAHPIPTFAQGGVKHGADVVFHSRELAPAPGAASAASAPAPAPAAAPAAPAGAGAGAAAAAAAAAAEPAEPAVAMRPSTGAELVGTETKAGPSS